MSIFFTSSRADERRTLLIASTDPEQRCFLAAQLDADGHTVYEANRPAAAVAKLSCYAIDVLMLDELQQPFEAIRLLRAIRSGEHERVHPDLPVITLALTMS